MLSKIFGNSLCVIDWEKGKTSLRSVCLSHWIQRVQALILKNPATIFSRLYRRYNGEADRLSKLYLGPMDGRLFFIEFIDGTRHDESSLD